MGYLIVSKIPYAKWLKFMMPLFLIWTFAAACLCWAPLELVINKQLGNNGTR